MRLLSNSIIRSLSPLPFPRHRPGRAVLGALAVALGCGDTLDALESGDTFGRIYDTDSFQACAGCHAPGAPGRTADIEATQDWSTRDTAYTTLHDTASGMIGNFEGCNGVPFLGASAEQSLLVAALDETVRVNFSVPGKPQCNSDAISDQTAKIGGPLPADLLQDLKDWIDSGAP
jgi:hypothetical protein